MNLRTVRWRGILAVLGGFIAHLTYGTTYTIGNMDTYIISYLRVQQKSKVTYTDGLWLVAMMNIGQGIFMVTGGILERRIGIRMTVTIGSLIMSVGVYLTYFTIQNSFLLVLLTYCLMFSIGFSMAYIPPLMIGMKWFPDHKGAVNGIIVAGFGLGGFIFDQVQTAYLNPWNIETDEDGYFSDPRLLERVPRVFLLLSGTYVAMQMVGCLLLSEPPQNILDISESQTTIQTQDNSYTMGSISETGRFSTESTVSLPSNFTGTTDLSPRQILKTKEFYIMWFTFFLNNQAVSYINSMYKVYGQTFIHDDHFLALVGSLSAVFNCSGRVIWGLLIDLSNYRVCMLSSTALLFSLFMSLSATPYGGKIVFALWVFGIFFSFSGMFVLFPTSTTITFGPKYAGTNYGLVFTNLAFAGPASAIFVQFVSSSLGWNGTFGIIASILFLSLIITYYYPEEPNLVTRRTVTK